MAETILFVYGISCTVLIFVGLHRIWLLTDFLRLSNRAIENDEPAKTPGCWMPVTIQLPVYNEKTVVERLINAACELDYPKEKLEIQVLDDSTDETSDIIAAVVARWRDQGVRITHLKREKRTGYKAGALSEGMNQATGEAIAIFDADFVPDTDFLRKMVPLLDDASVGMVQARWGHLNAHCNLLTHAQAVFLDEHFSIEHRVRHQRSRFFNFNGTAGIWRKTDIMRAGGWDSSTLTEDLDLSFRAQLEGVRFLYSDLVEVKSELPTDMSAFKAQQHRWAKGSVQTARKLLARLWRSEYPIAVRIDATAKLLQNCTFIFLAMVVATMPIVAMLFYGEDSVLAKTFLTGTLVFAMLPVAISFLVAQRARGYSWSLSLIRIPIALSIGAALTINNARAAWEGLAGSGQNEFVRTPKQGDKRSKVYNTPLHWSVLVEAALGCFHLLSAGALTAAGEFWATPFLWSFGVALLGISLWSVWDGRQRFLMSISK
jgi:cellulose synthase/poly-beta-1,6-N-acetylglucosamine synthase-like glycosyltransferase